MLFFGYKINFSKQKTLTRFDYNWETVMWYAQQLRMCGELPPYRTLLKYHITSNIFGILFLVWYTWFCQNSNKPVLYWNTATYDCVWLTAWRILLFGLAVNIIHFMGPLRNVTLLHIKLYLIANTRDTTWPKPIQHGRPQPNSNILHIENQIVCGIEIYII